MCTISDEFELLLRQLNIYLDSEQIVKVFEEANVDKAGEADAQIDVDYHRGTRRPMCKVVFAQFVTNTTCIGGLVSVGGGGGGEGEGFCIHPFPSPHSQPVFLNVDGARESIPRNKFCQPM